MRLERGEGIIGNLGLGGRHRRDKGRLARIRKSNQARIGEQFQFELQLEFLAGASFLVITRSSIGRGGEMRVAKSAAAAARRQPPLTVLVKVKQQLVCQRIENLR